MILMKPSKISLSDNFAVSFLTLSRKPRKTVVAMFTRQSHVAHLAFS